MRLLDLHPTWTGPDGFSFSCPLHPGRVVPVYLGHGGHRVTSLTRDFATLSLDPSLHNVHHGNGRACGLHVVLRNGVLLPAQ